MIRNNPSEDDSQKAIARAPLEKVWEFEAGGDIIHKAVAYGMVFFGSKDKRIYALDAASGQERWAFEMDKAVRPETPLAVADGILYAFGKDRNLYAIDAQTGEKRWRFFTGRDISPPIVANGVVYVSDGRVLYALDAQTGQERWRSSTGKDIGLPAVGYGMVCFGSKDERIYALDASSGEKRWEFRSGYSNHSRPAVTGGKILIGGDDDLYTLDANSGALAWRIKKALHYRSPPIVAGNLVICPNELTVVDLASGAEKTKFAPRMKFLSKDLHVKNGILYAAAGGTLIALDLATGQLKWYAVIATSWPHYLDWTVSEEFVFATARSYPETTYGISISRLTKRWEFPETGPVPLFGEMRSDCIIAGEMAFVSRGKKMFGYTSSKDPAAQSLLEIGEEVALSPKYAACVLLTTAGFLGGKGQISWPNCCCLCCGPVEKRVDLVETKDRVTLRAEGIPYCATCYEKTMRGIRKKEKPGVEITRTSPPTFAFRNEKYWGMFMQANRSR